MIALLIVLGILAGIALLLLSSVSFKICLDGDVQLIIRYLFIKKKVPYKPEKVKKAEMEDQKGTDRKPKKSEPYLKKSIREKGIAATVSELSDVLFAILKKLGNIIRHIRVRRFRLNITAAADDPAVTAIEYGSICAVVFPAVSVLKNSMKFNEIVKAID